MAARKIGVNLAARPLRNRRFFHLLVGGMAAIFLIVAIISLSVFFRGRSADRRAAASLVRAGQTIESARADRDAWSAQVRDWTKARRPTIDAVNGILLGKSFSWTDFFSRLEASMPPSCLIVQMAPLVVRDGRIEARFKLSSPTLEELLSFIQKLNGQGFKNIAVRQEAQGGGRWISEIELTHERAF